MNAIGNLLSNFHNIFCCICELLRRALIFLWAMFYPRAILAARLLAVESQLAICKHHICLSYKENSADLFSAIGMGEQITNFAGLGFTSPSR